MPQATDRFVFVYGTLRRTALNDINRMQPPPVYLGRAEVAGTLYDLGHYPGLALGGSDRVQGEVYRITSELEYRLDVLEEVLPQPSGEYQRREIRVTLREAVNEADEGRVLDCLCYEIAPQRARGRPVIAGGDWCARGRGG